MKYLVCDLDNTLLDTLQELEKMVEGYKISKQSDYRLVGKELEPFLNGTIYNNVSLNQEVVDTIQHYLSKNYQLIFISQTFTDVARKQKQSIIDCFAKQVGHNSFPLIMNKEELFDEIEELCGDIVFIDDAPGRLLWFEKEFPQSKVYKVEYPYNAAIGNANTTTIQRGNGERVCII